MNGDGFVGLVCKLRYALAQLETAKLGFARHKALTAKL